MRAAVKFNQFASVSKVVASSGHHFSEFRKQIMLSTDLYHLVELRNLHECFAQTIQSVS